MNELDFNKTRFLFKKIHIYKLYLYIICFSALIFAIGWATNTRIVEKIITIEDPPEPRIPFSEDALINLIEECHIKYPYIVLAQARLESGHFTSKVFKENHNMFGMRKANQRITSAKGEKNTYAYYRDWMDCVYDYAMYQSSVMCSVSNENEYLNRLGAKYAEDPEYVVKLKRIIQDEKIKSMFED